MSFCLSLEFKMSEWVSCSAVSCEAQLFIPHIKLARMRAIVTDFPADKEVGLDNNAAAIACKKPTFES